MQEEMSCQEKEKYWNQVLTSWKESGIGLERWCKENGYPHYMARYWRRKFFPTKQKKTFLEMQDHTSQEKEMYLCVGKTRIQVERGFDPELLREIVSALGGL